MTTPHGTPRTSKRHTLPRRRMVVVECLSCGWKPPAAANAQGIAAQHADSHPTHKVHVEVTQSWVYVRD